MKRNSLNLVLNAHMPFVRHPEYPRFLEEDWLFEAIGETYLPLLRMLRKLRDENVPFRLTLSISPTLCSMLADPVLQGRFTDFLHLHQELGEKEVKRCSEEEPECLEMAQFYLDQINTNLQEYFELYQCNILGGFLDLEESGHLELITTAATHTYLPLYSEYPSAINAQVELAVQSHVNHFKKRPKGFWLPECGYYPNLEEYLQKEEFEYFQLSAQSLILSEDKVQRGSYAPVSCPNGVHAFARDYHLTSLVWSNSEGYPADVDYREFYRDIGYDLPFDYIEPYIHSPNVRVFTGFKYYAITGNGNEKRFYDITKAQEKVIKHAKNFLYTVKEKGNKIGDLLDRDPFYTVAFDAELFGHWWFEGINWLETLFRLAADDKEIVFETGSDYLKRHPENQILQPAYSSWGDGGYSNVWANGSNVWAYKHIHKAIERMEELAIRFPDQSSLKQRFLNQAAREVLLAMSSDWPFIIHNGTNVTYATNRLKEHLGNFNLVYENMCKNAVNTEWLVKAEKRNILFPDIDYNVFNLDSERNRYNG
ncbi:MAG: glycoside hydrolase family 57 protein [Sphaerochaetaceae bacterium]|jgi:1,4-alpha-glucan branching enzyme